MLEAINVTRHPDQKGGDIRELLESVSFSASASQVTLIVGAHASGKHSLLEILAGVRRADQGVLMLHGRDLSRQPLHPNELGLVSATSDDSLPGDLSTKETLASALLLRVKGLSRADFNARVTNLLSLCGLETVAAEHVNRLSPVQHRRLLLATALVSDPVLVLCQDFTNDIDAKSERELVALLKLIAAEIPGRMVINLTSSLSQLPAYDTAIVLHQGHVCFHGPPRAIAHYFTIKSVEDLYPRLAMRPAARWGESWTRHRDSYYEAFKIGSTPEDLAAALEDDGDTNSEPDRIRLPSTSVNPEDESQAQDGGPQSDAPSARPNGTPPPPHPLPGLLTQCALLVRRRWTLLRRSKREWRLQAFFFVSLPLLAVLLIWPNKGYLTAALDDKVTILPPETLWPAAFTCLMAAFTQVLLVIYIAVRNGAGEIARERAVIDRERLGGIRPAALLLSKVSYLFPLVLAQTLWLGLFVEMFTGGLPGPLWIRLALPSLTVLAFTSICLAISAFAATPGRAQFRCLTLVFAQVILAGALLGMPRVLGGIIHPFITAYYGWSGIVASMAPHPVVDAIGSLLRTTLAHPTLALGALALHTLLGLLVTYFGLRRVRL